MCAEADMCGWQVERKEGRAEGKGEGGGERASERGRDLGKVGNSFSLCALLQDRLED